MILYSIIINKGLQIINLDIVSPWGSLTFAAIITKIWFVLTNKLLTVIWISFSIPSLYLLMSSPNLAFLCRNLDYKPYSINQKYLLIYYVYYTMYSIM